MDSLYADGGPATRFDPSLLHPLRDAVGLFDALRIPYALIGGIAAMVYGCTRFSLDIDFVASDDHEAVLQAHPDMMQQFHFDPTSPWDLYHKSGTAINICQEQHADEITARAKIMRWEGHALRIADPHDLIAMNLRGGRLQDDYDVSEILKNVQIDEAIMKQRVTPEQFAHLQMIQSRKRK